MDGNTGLAGGSLLGSGGLQYLRRPNPHFFGFGKTCAIPQVFILKEFKYH